MPLCNELGEDARKYYSTKFKAALKSLQRGWTWHVNARTANGVDVSPLDPTACCYCAIGAIHSSFIDEKTQAVNHADRHGLGTMFALLSERPELQGDFISAWNDKEERTQKEVVQVFKNIVKSLA